MNVFTLCVVIVVTVALLFIIVEQRRTIAELLDRIMALQALPPVSSPLEQAKEMVKKQEPLAPKERPVKERVRFHMTQPL